MISFNLRVAEADLELPTYDNTKLVAVSTCPVYGLVRYEHHKTFNKASRAIPLEAGALMHDVFAWVRLCTLMKQTAGVSFTMAQWGSMFDHHMRRLFGDKRAAEIMAGMELRDVLVDHLAFTKAAAINVLNSGTFYDDPGDRRRTLTNMEEAALAYVDRWNWKLPVWQQNPDDPTGLVGIELPFDIVVDVQDYHAHDVHVDQLRFRYTGKIDGIHQTEDGEIILGENKTASRVDDAWSMAFATNSQITGYCLAASLIADATVKKAVLHGITIPLPRSYDYGGIVTEHLSRRAFHFDRWVHWLLYCVNIYETYRNHPLEAPMFTHSCNRYFRPCAFLPLCDSDDAERGAIFESMDTLEWSPLHETD